jgi:formylglycine-generating enzyme required for sulfatase activity
MIKPSILYTATVIIFLAACGKDLIQTGQQGNAGRDGANALTMVNEEPKGDHCAHGGVRIDAGLDSNRDAELSESEITSTQYICAAESGIDGVNALTMVNEEPEGEHCVHGGVRIDAGLDSNRDAELSESEITSTQYICAAESGIDGACSDNVVPMIEANISSGVTYWVGNKYSLTVTANKAGLDYRFAAQNLKFERIPGETQSDGGFVSTWKVTPLAEAQSIIATIVASDGCQMASAEFHLQDVRNELIDWVSIPAGSFLSAVPNSGNVSIDAFKIARTETTVAQFQECIAAGICQTEYFQSYNENFEIDTRTSQTIQNSLIYYEKICNFGRGDDWLDHPMNCVTQQGAQQFCEWASGRLPTEDEWQYAATSDENGARETTYPWGSEEPTCLHGNVRLIIGNPVEQIYCNIEYIEIDEYDYYFTIFDSREVGAYSPAGDSPLGVQQMFGNVVQWTASLDESNQARAIAKGHPWYSFCPACSSSYSGLPVLDFRDSWPIDDWHSLVGFRCAQ